MELKRLAEHIWYMPFEEERDRPNLGYVKGNNWSLAIDAGHSAAHTREFYRLLEKENLPFPCLTVLTHWHWDHTFGMHAVKGLTLANEKTNGYLAEWKDRIEKAGPKEFLALHESIRREYSENREVIVKQADMVFPERLRLTWAAVRSGLFRQKRPIQTILRLFMRFRTKRCFSAILPETIFLQGSKKRISAGNWRIRSGESIPEYAWRATGFPCRLKTRWRI